MRILHVHMHEHKRDSEWRGGARTAQEAVKAFGHHFMCGQPRPQHCAPPSLLRPQTMPGITEAECDEHEKSGNNEIPHARIKEELTIGTETHVILTYEDNKELEIFVPSENLVDPEKEYQQTSTTCNTRKDVGSLYYRRSAGIFVMSWPCGVVPFFSEIFGTENVSQVHGLICDFMLQPASNFTASFMTIPVI